MKGNNEIINKLKYQLNSMLLQALGYEISGNGCVVDQDSLSKISYRNRILKCSDNGSYVPLHSRDMLFDPITNRGLAEQLFMAFMHKEDVDNGIYMHMYYTMSDTGNTSRMFVEAILENSTGERFIQRSGCYTSPTYCYLDLILRIYNNGINNDFEEIIHRLEEYLKDDLQ